MADFKSTYNVPIGRKTVHYEFTPIWCYVIGVWVYLDLAEFGY